MTATAPTLSLILPPAAALSAVQTLRTELEGILLERKDEIACGLTTLIAGEHLLLLGPPGTAKSLLGELLSQAMEATTFTRLLTKHTVPEELFGPYSIAGLEADRYERKIDGYLPSAQIGILDEIFKCNSAILNSLLTLLNERAFDNGNRRGKVPLEWCLGMSNEIPQDEGLGALYDRFIVRCWTSYLSDADHFRSLLLSEEAPKVQARLTQNNLSALREAAGKVKIPAEVVDAILKIRTALAEKGIQPSDRRYKKAMKLIRASAVLDGRMEASVDDLMILENVLWDKPEHRAEVTATVIANTSPDFATANALRDGAIQEFQKVNLSAVEAGPVIKVRRALEAILKELAALRPSLKIAAIIEEVKAMDTELKRAASEALGL